MWLLTYFFSFTNFCGKRHENQVFMYSKFEFITYHASFCISLKKKALPLKLKTEFFVFSVYFIFYSCSVTDKDKVREYPF